MTFQNPAAFLLLLLPALLIFLWLKREGRGQGYPSFAYLGEFTLKERLAYLPEVFLVLSLFFLIIALARPQKGFSQVRQVTKGIAIEMVIDRSGSMQAAVTQTENRLDVVKDIFADFVLARPSDMIGLITFARYADTHAPLTLAHGVLPGFIDTIHLADRESEDGTAIGDALALAAARLETVKEEEGYQIKSKVIILLTDGVNNAGKTAPEEAAKLAAQWGIKVYPIGFSRPSLMGQLMGRGFDVDEESLKEIAAITGGEYYTADDRAGLQKVISRIDELETSEVEAYSYREYEEVYLPFALCGLVLLLAYLVLSATLFRRLEL